MSKRPCWRPANRNHYNKKETALRVRSPTGQESRLGYSRAPHRPGLWPWRPPAKRPGSYGLQAASYAALSGRPRRRGQFPAEAPRPVRGGILACGAGGFLFKAVGFGQPYEVRLYAWCRRLSGDCDTAASSWPVTAGSQKTLRLTCAPQSSLCLFPCLNPLQNSVWVLPNAMPRCILLANAPIHKV